MEVRGLQEALKVEIQCHQDGELKRQLHDRRISALSDKQEVALKELTMDSLSQLYIHQQKEVNKECEASQGCFDWSLFCRPVIGLLLSNATL